MAAVIGAELGTGSGFGAGLAAGTASGIGASGGTRAALLAFAGAGRDATVGSEALGTGKENFKANWQSMLRAWGVSARDPGETPEEAESAKTDPAIERATRENTSDLRAMRAGNEAVQSALAACGKNGSTATGGALAHNIVRANQPQPSTDGTIVAAGAQNAAAWSATKATGGIANTPVSSKIKDRLSDSEDSGAQGRATRGADGTTGSPVVGSDLTAQAAMPLQVNTPPTQSNHSAPDRLGEVDDRVAGRTRMTNQVAPATTAAVDTATVAASGMPSIAAETPTASARASAHIPIHAAQTPTSGHAMNPGAAAAVEPQDRQEVDEQEDFGAPPDSDLMAAEIATASALKPANAMDVGTNSECGERKTAIEGFGAHRGVDETGRTPVVPASPPRATDNPSAENGANSPQPPLMQSEHQAAGKANAAISQQTGAHVAIAQNSGIEVSVMVRDPAGAHGTANTPATIGSSTAGPASVPQETFAALDAGSTVGTPNWVHAGGRQAEAGFEDPALGWVGVRADLSRGSVHAEVVPGSTEAAQALSGHLAGLSTYLSENHTPVGTLNMAAPGNSGAGSGPDQSMGQGQNEGMQHSAGERGEQSAATAPQPSAGQSATISSANSATQVNGIDVTAYTRDGLGMHISVMA